MLRTFLESFFLGAGLTFTLAVIARPKRASRRRAPAGAGLPARLPGGRVPRRVRLHDLGDL